MMKGRGRKYEVGSRKELIISAIFFFMPAASTAGLNSTGLMLLKSPSAIAQSMGDAFASVSGEVGGVSALHYNPAGTAYLKRPELYLMGRNGIADDNFGGLIFGLPSAFGTFSGGFSYYRVGDIELVNPEGQRRSVKAQQDMLGNLNYGKTISSHFALGMNLKFLRSKLVETVSANTFAGDFGGQMKLNRFSFGLAVQNVGRPMKYQNATEPLPLLIRGGLSQKIDFKSYDMPGRLLWSFDLVQEKDAGLKKLLGVEYLWNNMIALRSGSKFDRNSGRLQIGFGFIVGQIQLDYDHLNLDNINGVHMVSATYRFASIPSKTPAN